MKALDGKEAIAAYLAETLALERDLLAEKEKSKKMGHRFGYAGLALGFLGMLAGIAGLRQEPPPPVILHINDTTGAVESTTVQK